MLSGRSRSACARLLCHATIYISASAPAPSQPKRDHDVRAFHGLGSEGLSFKESRTEPKTKLRARLGSVSKTGFCGQEHIVHVALRRCGERQPVHDTVMMLMLAHVLLIYSKQFCCPTVRGFVLPRNTALHRTFRVQIAPTLGRHASQGLRRTASRQPPMWHSRRSRNTTRTVGRTMRNDGINTGII